MTLGEGDFDTMISILSISCRILLIALVRHIFLFETVVKTPGLSSSCMMEYCQGLLTACSLGFTPHVQCQACPDLCLRAYPIDLLLHLAIASVAPLHDIRGRREQLVIQKRQGLFSRGREELLERLTQLGKPQEPPPQVVQFVQGSLGPASPIKQGVDLFHQRAQRA